MMPNRVIRESLLDSERYWSCTIEARELYRHLQLLADDLGCVSLAPVFLRRRCFDNAPVQGKIDGFLQQLSDHDLIRIYEVEHARYAFLPRFGQRLRRMHLKHPRPPESLLQGDGEALEKFSKIKGGVLKLSDTRLAEDGHVTAEGNRSESNRSESKGIEGTARGRAVTQTGTEGQGRLIEKTEGRKACQHPKCIKPASLHIQGNYVCHEHARFYTEEPRA